MQILDETVGAFNWQCGYHEVKGNMYCEIRIYDKEKNQWITKEDCGVESAFGDKEKGEASDAFKRAGFKWGIGTELYTSPFIWIKAEDCNIMQNNNTFKCYDKFYVEAIQITDKTIIKNHILSKEEIIDYRKYAADVVEDNEINVSDNTKLGNYLLGKITTLN